MTDTIFGYGDTPGDLAGRDMAGADTLHGQIGPVVNELYGDAGGALLDRAHGGDDLLAGMPAFVNVLIGDADRMRGRSLGGDDTLLGAVGTTVNQLVGDARTLTDRARGGADQLVGGDGAFQNILYGDAFVLDGRARGGDDVLVGGRPGFNGPAGAVLAPLNLLVGDAPTIEGSARGGDDRLVGGDGALANTMYGDAIVLAGRARGGDDTLVGSDAVDMMFGDARDVGPDAATGRDLFVIVPGGGADTIGDFEPGRDRLDLSGFADLRDWRDLAFEATPEGLLLGFADDGSVTFAGVLALRHGDILFG